MYNINNIYELSKLCVLCLKITITFTVGIIFRIIIWTYDHDYVIVNMQCAYTVVIWLQNIILENRTTRRNEMFDLHPAFSCNIPGYSKCTNRECMH